MKKEKMGIQNPEIIINQYINYIPVPIEQIINDCGIILKLIFDENGSSGSIKVTNDRKYIISVNVLHIYGRQRFTMAHELAHYILHKDEIDVNGISDDAIYHSGKSELIEIEANRKAADIIMPSQSIINQYMKYKPQKTETHVLVNKMAIDFSVSELAMEIRLQSFNLI